ncbi:LysR substrate-binding domain-containing protein [uncultured Salipiger sp.]|uniref:LysR substrate-binding domain-containing protein n=1 Tax=uncultured Salipiger sp. TaxID=499810 RepID=UPI0033901F9E
MARTNMRQIEAFNAVMKCGSVTRAAETLFVSQPAVTKLIRAFEDSCGFALFERSAGRLHPTAEAQRLFLETEKLLTGVARVENVARAIRDLERGEVAVTAYPALSLRFLPIIASEFLSERPDVRLAIETRNSQSVYEAMLNGSSDFGISLVPTRHSGIECKPFHDNLLVCALPPGHRLTEKPIVDLRELVHERFISLGRDDLSTVVTKEAFDRAGVEIDAAIRVQMADTACTFVARGQGVALVPVLATLGWRSDEIELRPIWPSVNKTMWLYTRTYEPLSMLAGLLLGRVREALDEINDKYRPDLEAISELPPLPVF